MSLITRLRKHARPLARLGCVSIGTVYVVVGVMALLALSGRSIEQADEYRMLRVLEDVPAGPVLIWLIVCGILGYIVWRSIEAVSDPYDFGNDWTGLAFRTGVALSAFGYGVIAYAAARFATGNGPRGDRDATEEQQQLFVAQILEWPLGAWFVGGAGLLVALTGLLQFVLLVRRSYTMEVDCESRSPAVRNGIHALAWYGYAARGVILAVLGYFLLRAALQHDPSEVGDTDTAFDFIGGGTVGDSAFFVVAVGTVAYGVFMYACAAFYRFEPRREIRRGITGEQEIRRSG